MQVGAERPPIEPIELTVATESRLVESVLTAMTTQLEKEGHNLALVILNTGCLPPLAASQFLQSWPKAKKVNRFGGIFYCPYESFDLRAVAEASIRQTVNVAQTVTALPRFVPLNSKPARLLLLDLGVVPSHEWPHRQPELPQVQPPAPQVQPPAQPVFMGAAHGNMLDMDSTPGAPRNNNHRNMQFGFQGADHMRSAALAALGGSGTWGYNPQSAPNSFPSSLGARGCVNMPSSQPFFSRRF